MITTKSFGNKKSIFSSFFDKKNKGRSPNTNYINKSYNGYNYKGVSKNNLSLPPVLKKVLWLIFLLPLSIGAILFYVYILRDLPSLENIEKLSLAQTTNITDRNGKVLYKDYSENREYVNLSDISQDMQNAIVAMEDQNFWTHGGIDIQGIIRAAIFSEGGGSTIPQQLIKNILLTSERTFIRKAKEIILSIRLKNTLENDIEKTHPDYDSDAIKKAAKSKVLELYLNYIFLGNNSYGVQAASYTYFGTSANNLGIIESAILASIPKAPTRYNPYSDKDALMGKLEVVNSDGDKQVLQGNMLDNLIANISEKINDPEASIPRDNGKFIEYIKGLISFDYEYNGQTYKVSYTYGRKDFALERMYVDGYIDESQLKLNFVKGLNYKFTYQKNKMIAPHFVFWVKQKLADDAKKYNINSEDLAKGGYIVKTTLDYSIQEIAEKSVQENMGGIRSYGANNSALIHIDSKEGDVLAYVGSADYYDESIKGQNDIIQSMQQPGSTIKPIIYALGFITLPLTIDTEIFDIPFKIGKNTPQNVDGKFMGPMPLRKALAYSRNIPAIKMFFAIGEDSAIIKFFKSLGANSFIGRENGNYGYPMAIGGAEMKMLELANMYSHLSAMGTPGELDPILEIKTADGTVVYKKGSKQQSQIIPAGVAYLLRDILSDPSSMPADWARKFSFSGIKFAHKTGTTNKPANRKGVKYPKDGRLATYTPSKVTIFWAGNTDDEPMNLNAYGGRVNHPTWKTFWTRLKAKGYIKNESMPQVEVKSITISRLSGKIATSSTPAAYAITTLGYVNNLPSVADDTFRKIEIDKLCYGKVTELTPPEDIITSYIAVPQTFMPNKMDLDDIISYLGGSVRSEIYDLEKMKDFNAFTSEPTEPCLERGYINEDGEFVSGLNSVLSGNNASGDISTSGDTVIVDPNNKPDLSILKPSDGSKVANNFALRYNIKGKNTPIQAIISIDGQEIMTLSYNKTNITEIKNISLDKSKSEKVSIKINIIDSAGNQTNKVITVTLGSKDTKVPYIVKNKTTVKKTDDGLYTATLLFSDLDSNVKGGSIYMGSTKLLDFEGNLANFVIPNPSTISYTVQDAYGNNLKDTIDLSKYSK